MKNLHNKEENNNAVLYIQKTFGLSPKIPPNNCPSYKILQEFFSCPKKGQEKVFLHLQSCPKCAGIMMELEEKAHAKIIVKVEKDVPIFILSQYQTQFSQQISPEHIAAGEAGINNLPAKLNFGKKFPNGEEIVLRFEHNSSKGGYLISIKGSDYNDISLVDLVIIYNDDTQSYFKGETFALDGAYITEEQANSIKSVELKCNFPIEK